MGWIDFGEEKIADKVEVLGIPAVTTGALLQELRNRIAYYEQEDARKAAEIDRQRERLQMFERLIHTNSCSDEGGWFAFFTPNGPDDMSAFTQRVNGCQSEEEALTELVKWVVEELKNIR